MKKFKQGEIAVLLHSTGGRLFKIYRPFAAGVYQEKSTINSQQPYALKVYEQHLVKCKDEAAAVALVEKLEAAHAVYSKEVSNAAMKRSAAQQETIRDHNKATEDDL